MHHLGHRLRVDVNNGATIYEDSNNEHQWLTHTLGLYTDESPGLKVDPFVVLVLSVGFIISVVALHSESLSPDSQSRLRGIMTDSHSVIAKITRKFTS